MARKVRQIRQKGKDVSIEPELRTAAPDEEAFVALIQAFISVASDRVMLSRHVSVAAHTLRSRYGMIVVTK